MSSSANGVLRALCVKLAVSVNFRMTDRIKNKHNFVFIDLNASIMETFNVALISFCASSYYNCSLKESVKLKLGVSGT